MSTLRFSLLGLGTRVALMIVNIISVILLARFLEPGGRGEYFLFQTVVMVLSVVGDLGLSQSANVFIAKHLEKRMEVHALLVRAAWGISLVVSACGAGMLWFGRDWMLPHFPAGLEWVAFSLLPAMLYAGFWNSMMIGLGKIELLNGVQLVLGPFQLLLIVVLVVALSGGVTAAVGIYVATMLLQAVLMRWCAGRIGLAGRAQLSGDGFAKSLVGFGVRAYPNALATMLWQRAPVFLLNGFHGAVSVGIFSVAQQLAEKLMMPVQATQDAIYRKMAVLSPQDAVTALNRYLRVMVCTMVVIVGVGIVLSPWIIRGLFGESYQQAAAVLGVLLVGIAFVSAAMIISTYVLSHRERPGLLSILAGANAMTCLGLGVLLIPVWAEIGAAGALVLTQVTGTVIVFVLYLGMAQASVKEALWITRQDMVELSDQLMKLVPWRRASI